MKPKIQLLKALEDIRGILVETLGDGGLQSIRPSEEEDEELENRKKVLRDTFNRTARPSDDNEDEEEEEQPKPKGKQIPFRPLVTAREKASDDAFNRTVPDRMQLSIENDMLRLDIDDSGTAREKASIDAFSQGMTREERMKVIDVIKKIDKQIGFLTMKKKDLMQAYGIVGDDSPLVQDDEGFP